MNGQDYLNQISATNRPVKVSKLNKILSSRLFWVGLAAIVAFIIIVIIGSVISNNKTDPKTLSYSLNLHLENTSKVILSYQNEIKSSDLRAISSSLNSILSKTKNDLDSFLSENSDYKSKNVSQKIIDQANLEKDGLESELFEAKINGNLDRIYAHKMTYEISKIANEETKIIQSTKNDQLKELLITSHNSLLNLYENFNNFSETN